VTNPTDDGHRRLTQLLEELGPRLRAAVAVRCASDRRLDPDDLEQEVRIRIWKAFERDRNAAFAASYIQKVVLSVVIDAGRRAQVRAAERLPDEDDGAATPEAMVMAEEPQRQAIEAQRMALVKRAVGELPYRRRMPVQLHLQGFSFGEVGRLTGVSEEAARKLVTRGMIELRTRLAELGVSDGEA